MYLTDSRLMKLKKDYPVGARVELLQMYDTYAPPIGTKGTIKAVDSIGTIHIEWDNGSSLGCILGIDSFRIID